MTEKGKEKISFVKMRSDCHHLEMEMSVGEAKGWQKYYKIGVLTTSFFSFSKMSSKHLAPLPYI